MITVRYKEKNGIVSFIQTSFFTFQSCGDVANEVKSYLPELGVAYEKSKEYYVLHFVNEKIVKEVVSFDIICIDGIKEVTR